MSVHLHPLSIRTVQGRRRICYRHHNQLVLKPTCGFIISLRNQREVSSLNISTSGKLEILDLDGKGVLKMATSESYSEEECFNAYWKIKNFSYCCETIRSPEFSLAECYLWRYYLELCSTFSEIVCSLPNLQRYKVYEFEKMQISFLTCDGSPEESFSGKADASFKVVKDVIFGNRRNSFLPEDTLTVRFRLPTMYVRGNLFICSQIAVNRQYFLWTFKALNTNTCYREKSIEKSDRYGNINLNLKSMGGINSAEQFSIEISRTGGERCYCVLKVSVLDAEERAVIEVSDEFIFEKEAGQQTRGFPSIIKKSKWIACENLLLSENKLSLKCYFAISSGTVSNQTAEISFCENATPLLKESHDLSMSFKGKNDSCPALDLQTDLKSILDNGTLFDVSLQIGTEVVQVHRNILSARSPVFKAMFTKDMKEAINNAVVIEDLDVETVRRLVLYMYTDTIHNDHWKDVKKLYFAANKYEVLSLKKECASFLKTNLSISNVSEALVVADLHQDGDLKTAALHFISEYNSAVFASEEWKELEKNNSSLVIQAMREICCSKRFR